MTAASSRPSYSAWLWSRFFRTFWNITTKHQRFQSRVRRSRGTQNQRGVGFFIFLYKYKNIKIILQCTRIEMYNTKIFVTKQQGWKVHVETTNCTPMLRNISVIGVSLVVIWNYRVPSQERGGRTWCGAPHFLSKMQVRGFCYALELGFDWAPSGLVSLCIPGGHGDQHRLFKTHVTLSSVRHCSALTETSGRRSTRLAMTRRSSSSSSPPGPTARQSVASRN